MPVARYRKKPVVIEAMQFMGGAAAATPVVNWVLEGGGTARFHSDTDAGSLAINTMEGTMRADPGDWVIKGVKGEFYPVKPNIFEATYEPA